jgi:hypothetical protein
VHKDVLPFSTRDAVGKNLNNTTNLLMKTMADAADI